MVVLGLLLMLGCAALAVDAALQNTGLVAATAFDQQISTLSLGAVFIAGAVVGLLFALGLALFSAGTGRAVRRSRHRRQLREDNARLERELDGRPSSAYPADAYPAEPVSSLPPSPAPSPA